MKCLGIINCALSESECSQECPVPENRQNCPNAWYQENKQPASPSAPSNDYWKKRCEAAEKLLDAVDNNINKRFVGYDEWQKLKNERNQLNEG